VPKYFRLILDSSVEHALAWIWQAVWQGATTLRAGTRKEEQRNQTGSRGLMSGQ